MKINYIPGNIPVLCCSNCGIQIKEFQDFTVTEFKAIKFGDLEARHCDTCKELQDCDECKGTGEVHYSCCGDNVKDKEAEDYDLCPTCKEHLPGREVCESCNGSGKITPL